MEIAGKFIFCIIKSGGVIMKRKSLYQECAHLLYPVEDWKIDEDVIMALHLYEKSYFGDRKRACDQCRDYMNGTCIGESFTTSDEVFACLHGKALYTKLQCEKDGIPFIKKR